jgi:hypothetical protein
MTADALARRLSGDHEPAVPIGLASLASSAFAGADLAPIGSRLIERVMADAHDAAALMDLSTILQLVGDRDAGMAWQAHALEVQQLYRRPPALVAPDGIRVLAFLAPGDFTANTPLEFLLQDSDVTLDMHYVVPGSPLVQPIPDHDIAFVAAGESDDNIAVLRQIEDFVRSWPRPVLNRPERIVALPRDGACALLESAPGLCVPMPARPEREFCVAPFIDYRGPDGLFRKYRIAMIDGRPFACHMAISENWNSHYFNAGMRESAEKRAEEARFIADFDDDFARRHDGALRAISERIDLDYFVIDCAETPDGKLLVFKLDVAMIIHSMDSPELFPHKPPQMRKVRDAFRAMLRRKCGRLTAI